MGVRNLIFIIFVILKRIVEMSKWARLWDGNWGNCSISQTNPACPAQGCDHHSAI